MKTLTLSLLMLMLFACGETATTEDVDATATEVPEATMPDRQDEIAEMQPAPELQQTINAVESAGGDVTALDPNTAVSNIDGWISKLGDMDGTDGIVNDLESLKTELSAGEIDGGKVSELLSNLADQTREVGGGNPALGTLASALQSGADKLAGK